MSLESSLGGTAKLFFTGCHFLQYERESRVAVPKNDRVELHGEAVFDLDCAVLKMMF